MQQFNKAFKYYLDIYMYFLFKNNISVKFDGYHNDSTTIYDISKVIIKDNNDIHIYTNSIGLLCKQSYLPEYIRHMCLSDIVNKKIIEIFHDEFCIYYIYSMYAHCNVKTYLSMLNSVHFSQQNKRYSTTSYNYDFVYTNKYVSKKHILSIMKDIFSFAKNVNIVSGSIFSVRNKCVDVFGVNFRISKSIIGSRIFYVNCITINIEIDSFYADGILMNKIELLKEMSESVFALAHVFLKIYIIGAESKSFMLNKDSRVGINTIIFKKDRTYRNISIFKIN